MAHGILSLCIKIEHQALRCHTKAFQAQGQCGCDLATTHESACGDHRNITTPSVNHSHQHQHRDVALVAASLKALGNNYVKAPRLLARSVLWPTTHSADGDVIGT